MAEKAVLGELYFYQVKLRIFSVTKVKKETIWNGSSECFRIEFFLCSYVNSFQSEKGFRRCGNHLLEIRFVFEGDFAIPFAVVDYVHCALLPNIVG